MEALVFVALLIILYMVEMIYYRIHALDNLRLNVDFDKRVAGYGDDIELVEVVENRKSLPLPFVILKFECPRELIFYDMTNTSSSDLLYRKDMLTMEPYSKHTRRIKAKCSKRGYYVLPRVGLTTADLLLTQNFVLDYPNDSYLVVLPEILDTELIRMLTSVTLSELQRRRTLLTDPFTLAGIREYGPEDPMKSINWKASAKTGDLMVNQNASACARRVHIFVNLDYYNQKHSISLLEKTISLTYTYLRELAALDIPASVYTNGLDILTGMPAISETDMGSATLDERAIMLARIDLKKTVVSYADMLEKYITSTDAGDFILLISPQFSGDFRSLLPDLISRRPSLRWLMPSYKTTPDAVIESSISHCYMRLEVPGND